MAQPHETGSAGETAARAYLETQGFRILNCNWRYLHLEIDIVALHGDRLVIVEVKTRATDAFGEPETFVTLQKQRRLIRAANHYLEVFGLGHEVRFDVVSVLSGEGGPQIRHIPDAFSPLVR